MVVGFTTTMKSVSIITNVVSSNSAHGEVYSMQRYVLLSVSDWWQVDGFHRIFWFASTINTDHHDIAKILFKVSLYIITITPTIQGKGDKSFILMIKLIYKIIKTNHTHIEGLGIWCLTNSCFIIAIHIFTLVFGYIAKPLLLDYSFCFVTYCC